MKAINYFLKGFGFENVHDFLSTTFKIFYIGKLKITIPIIITLGTLREFIEVSLGLNLMAIVAFVWLIIAEFQTGVRASLKKKDERIQSRKIGRMFLKIGVYLQILWLLNSFSKNVESKEIAGFEINPFDWLYYIFLIGVIFQMVVSYLENLSSLGYREAKGILGVVLRKFNKWFEFDGTKDADNFNINKNGSSNSAEGETFTPQD
jgi:hypothetical protein